MALLYAEEIKVEIYKFDCRGHNAPAYGCNKPNDNSGNYYKVSDIERLKKELLYAEEIGKPLDFVFAEHGV